MTQTFTTKLNDVVRYLYNETKQNENPKIEALIAEDEELLDFYLDSLKIKAEMDKVQLMPSARSIDSILAFSKNYEPIL